MVAFSFSLLEQTWTKFHASYSEKQSLIRKIDINLWSKWNKKYRSWPILMDAFSFPLSDVNIDQVSAQ